jgi:hypothetical protein
MGGMEPGRGYAGGRRVMVHGHDSERGNPFPEETCPNSNPEPGDQR